MRLQQLQLIQALAEAGSLRAAAQRLHVTQPALTKALRALEEEFGTPLVLRGPKGARLTPAGERVAARAGTVLREIERAREDVDWLLRHQEAQVAVGVSPAAAVLILPGALARLRARWPQVRARVVDALYPRSMAALRAGEIDIAIGPLPPGDARRDLAVQPLFDAEQALVARRGHPLARARMLADLQHAPWVLTGPPDGPGDPRRLGFTEAGLAVPTVVLTCESFATLLSLLPQHDGVAVMPLSFFTQTGQTAGLVRLPLAQALPRVTLHAAWRADAPLPAPAAHLLDALEQEARTLREQGPQAATR